MEAKCSYNPEFTHSFPGCGSVEGELQNSYSIVAAPGGKTFSTGSDFRESLLESSKDRPILLIFLRQLGCTFAREAIDQLKSESEFLQSRGVEAVLVHMSGWQDAQERFSDMGVPSVSHFSDRSMKAYKAFELGRASLGMIFHPVAVFRALWLAISRGYSVGYAGGDCFQMPGVLLLNGGEVVHKVTPRHVGEKISYHSLVAALPASNSLGGLSHRER